MKLQAKNHIDQNSHKTIEWLASSPTTTAPLWDHVCVEQTTVRISWQNFSSTQTLFCNFLLLLLIYYVHHMI